MKTIICARDLSKNYGKFTAVDRISFDIQEGECFGFLGPNGAGTLVVNGMPAHIDNREIKKITGVIPQEISLDVDLTVYENLMVFSKFFDIPRPQAGQRISELLKFVELETKKKNKINQLSTGMKKRLLIARALLNDPQIIIAGAYFPVNIPGNCSSTSWSFLSWKSLHFI